MDGQKAMEILQLQERDRTERRLVGKRREIRKEPSIDKTGVRGNASDRTCGKTEDNRRAEILKTYQSQRRSRKVYQNEEKCEINVEVQC